MNVDELREAWPALSAEERFEAFQQLPRDDAEDFFASQTTRSQAAILTQIPEKQRRAWVRLLPPDDLADVIQETPPEERAAVLDLLDAPTRQEVVALLAYHEDRAGGLMNPRFARVRPDMTVDEAIRYVRRQAQDHIETLYYIYAIDESQRLVGVLSFRQLLTAPGASRVSDVMERDVVTVGENDDREAVAKVVQEHDFVAVPVVAADRRLLGIVTVDDIVDVLQEEATEDAQKMAGVQPLEAPYLRTSLGHMVRKRASWLAILFVGEMLTANAMARYQQEIARAVVLACFVPLIISSGGNSGSQASTLVIRAMALGQLRLREWWRVVSRELITGLALGAILASIGVLRILVWERLFHTYGAHHGLLAITVGLSVAGVVLWGTIAGSMLPFVLRRFGLDPASASAPLVATLVDVSGLGIYFTIAALVLRGTLL
jgi:magnesium transporter